MSYDWTKDLYVKYFWLLFFIILMTYHQKIFIYHYIIALLAVLVCCVIIHCKEKDTAPTKIGQPFLVHAAIIGLPSFSTYFFSKNLEQQVIIQFGVIDTMLFISLVVILLSYWRASKIPHIQKAEVENEEKDITFWSNILSFFGVAFPIGVHIAFENKDNEGFALLFTLLCLILIIESLYIYAKAIWKRTKD